TCASAHARGPGRIEPISGVAKAVQATVIQDGRSDWYRRLPPRSAPAAPGAYAARAALGDGGNFRVDSLSQRLFDSSNLSSAVSQSGPSAEVTRRVETNRPKPRLSRLRIRRVALSLRGRMPPF